MTGLLNRTRLAILAAALTLGGTATMALAETAFLEITLNVDEVNRPAAAAVYTKYKTPFPKTVPGALSKQLLLRDEDVQVLHEFSSAAAAEEYLKNPLFTKDFVGELKPLLAADPEIRIYLGE